jgi:hypothetical protein
MKTKKYIVEIKTETGIKKSPTRWDVYRSYNGADRFSRNNARKVIRSLNLERGQARFTKLEN